ncbi:MAG TPA: hypothetical protein VFC07_08000 [Verrucomicrobiae bacterium]|nr:hypothetical protein [Verrucomicrobiae bacterium]
MKLREYSMTGVKRSRRAARSGFTLMETMIAATLALLVIMATMDFLGVALRALSGTTAQSVLNGQAGNTIEKIQSRVRLATLVSNNASGTVLTMGFDDNPLVDSNGDGVAWNDQDHYEQFQIRTSNGTNSLIYIPNTASTNNYVVLVKSGIRALPGWQYFTVTNLSTALIRFSILDTYTNDYYQSVEIQGAAVSLNRKSVTNSVSILPY